MSSSGRKLVIEAGRADLRYWRDLWQFRELFYFLAWRDILVRYKQTSIGIAWALIRPLLTMVVFSFVFGRLAKMPAGGVPYPLLVFSAMLPWQFFASALSECSNSLIGNANLISKIYFPRLIVPASTIIVTLVDFLISASILVGLCFWYRYFPGWRVLALPLWMILAFGAAMGAGLWFSALNVKYRDFRYVVPFLVQFGLYVSPVGFSSEIVPEKYRLLYALNPMVGVIDGFRWAILGRPGGVDWITAGISLLIVAALVFSGVTYFRKVERLFADVI